jgi:D-xylose transport system permease protein
MSSIKGGTPSAKPATKEAAVADQIDPRLLVSQEGVKGYLHEFTRKIKGGELGSLPVVVGLILIWIVFQSLNSNFLSAQNLSNLSIDIVATGMISIGIVFVLLLGEIDLSAGAVSGVAAAVLAVLNVNKSWGPIAAIVAAIAVGTLLGLVQGWFFAKVGVPAFVVTLAGMLAWSGLQLQILGPNGTINLNNNGLVSKLSSYYFGQLIAAYGLAALATVGFFVASYVGNMRRKAAGVPSRTMADLIIRTVALGVISFGVAIILNQYKGLPLALLIFLVVCVGSDFILRRTVYGRKVFARASTSPGSGSRCS